MRLVLICKIKLLNYFLLKMIDSFNFSGSLVSIWWKFNSPCFCWFQSRRSTPSSMLHHLYLVCFGDRLIIEDSTSTPKTGMRFMRFCSASKKWFTRSTVHIELGTSPVSSFNSRVAVSWGFSFFSILPVTHCQIPGYIWFSDLFNNRYNGFPSSQRKIWQSTTRTTISVFTYY